MKNKKVLILLSVALVAIVVVVAVVMQKNSFKYRVTDELYSSNPMTNSLYVYADCNVLDSAKAKSVGKELIEERIKKIPNIDQAERNALVVYFYQIADTTVMPPKMLEVMKAKYATHEIIKQKMDYMVRGLMYSCVYDVEKKAIVHDTIRSTMLFIPKPGSIGIKL